MYIKIQKIRYIKINLVPGEGSVPEGMVLNSCDTQIQKSPVIRFWLCLYAEDTFKNT